MPQVGASGEPLLESANYVWDGSDWVKEEEAATSIESQAYGWSGAAWVKLSVNASGELIMANNLVPTSLAEGQVQVALTTMYTVPASTAIASIQILMYNSHSAIVEVILSVTKSGGTERQLLKIEMDEGSSHVFCIQALSAADLIRGIADVDDKVNYLVSGQVQ